MKVKNIENLINSKIRIFSLQTQDVYFVLYPDLQSLYLISLLVDKIWFNINQISLSYVYPFKSYFDYISENLFDFEEEYFLFFLENYFHSSDYAYNFLLKVLKFMEYKKIDKKVIVHSLKTPSKEAENIIKKFDNVLLLISSDVESFFNEFFYKKTLIKNISNIYFKDDNNIVHINKYKNVDYPLKEYILWWYHNWYFLNFPKSADKIVYLRLKEKRKKYDDNIYYAWTNEKYIKQLKKISRDSAMISTWRWCKFKCSYCFRGVKYSVVRQVPLEVIKKDLDFLEKLWYRHIYLYDDCFFSTNEGRLDEIINLFSKYKFSYQIASRYEVLNQQVLKKILKGNITRIQIWLQSISKTSNMESKRNLNIQDFVDTIQELKTKWINISIDLILWLPWDKIQDFIKTLNFAVSLSPNSIFINKLFLNPKTDLYDNKKKYGIFTQEDAWLKKDFYVPKILYNDTFSEYDIKVAEKYIISLKNKVNINIILR